MLPILQQPMRARDLAAALGLECEGEADISFVAALADLRPLALAYARVGTAASVDRACLISPARPDRLDGGAWIRSRAPRLDFARALRVLQVACGFVPCDRPAKIDPTALVHATASLGRNVVVGAGTVIGAGARIADGVTLGAGCRVKAGAVIGEDGYGFERDESGTPLRILHFGGVVIGDRVEVGSLATICQGTLSPTRVDDDCKIDDHVHVAHNVHLHPKVMLVACAEISGSVTIGEAAYVGPNASVRDNLTIGARAFVGVGAVVVRDVDPDTTVAGCPARVMEVRPR